MSFLSGRCFSAGVVLWLFWGVGGLSSTFSTTVTVEDRERRCSPDLVLSLRITARGVRVRACSQN